MKFRFPGKPLTRLPLVSASIVGLCGVLFFFSWGLPLNPEGIDEVDLTSAMDFLQAHPYLHIDETFSNRFMTPQGQKQLAEFQRIAKSQLTEMPSADVIREEQQVIDTLLQRVVQTADGSLLRALSLQPSRGIVQLGWLTHLFLHVGWLHLFGNLLFLLLVAPPLENLWGPSRFGLFFMTTGLLTAAMHVWLNPTSVNILAGASGAIAACFGAIALNFGAQAVRFELPTLNTPLKTFRLSIPIWMVCLTWMGAEFVGDFSRRAVAGDSAIIHLWGFVFGLALAALFRVPQMIRSNPAPARVDSSTFSTP